MAFTGALIKRGKLSIHVLVYTGYCFESASAITPFLEKPRVGTTSVFCSDIAKRLGCYVVAGYPELLESDELQQCTQNDQVVIQDTDYMDGDLSEPSSAKERRIVGANSAVMYGPAGEWIGGYRKTNLFRTDKTWAAAGVARLFGSSTESRTDSGSFQAPVSLLSISHPPCIMSL